jgi:hypothetical protein
MDSLIINNLRTVCLSLGDLLWQLLPHRPPRQPACCSTLFAGHHHRRTVAHAGILHTFFRRSIQPRQSGLDCPDDRIGQVVCRHSAWIHEGPTCPALGGTGFLWSFDYHPFRHLGLRQGETHTVFRRGGMICLEIFGADRAAPSIFRWRVLLRQNLFR